MQVDKLINDLTGGGYLKTDKIVEAFRKIKRADFVLEKDKAEAYSNYPLAIGFGQTISQPLTVAFMLELLSPQAGEKILDIGSGSGWTVALLAELVGSQGRVYGLEVIDELVEFAKNNVEKYSFIKKGIAFVWQGDGYEGLSDLSPFDKIIVSAAAPTVPVRLIEQLKIGGRLIIPIGRENSEQAIMVIDKINNREVKEKKFPGFIFVPLVTTNK
ncbi:MAG TPA: protein-L-isoaspartate(D-aspartate) O-methyltransferase [bacterium]|nr:protein-L-isoaspartate(D-aspartate) O-methyltransferase [bacterium]